MTKLERVVLHTFLNDYPQKATYQEIVGMLETDKVEYLEWFQHCEPQDIREAMFYLYQDLKNLVTHEILEYDKKFLTNQQEANVAVQLSQSDSTNKDTQTESNHV